VVDDKSCKDLTARLLYLDAIYPHDEVTFHMRSGGGQGTSGKVVYEAKQIKKTKEMGARILADNCGQPFEKVMKDFDRDYWMDAKESLAYGIVDGILDKL